MPEDGRTSLPRYRRWPPNKSAEEWRALNQEWVLLQELHRQGLGPPAPDYCAMLIKVTAEQQALNAVNVPRLHENDDEDEDGRGAHMPLSPGWASPTCWRCPHCASRFTWRRRPAGITGCPLCDGAVTEAPPPEEDVIRAWPVAETPPGARRIGPGSDGTPGGPSRG